MARKIIIDCDPGIDDTVALCQALFDPRLEVLAVTATAGTIDAGQATSNVQALLELLDPPRYPRLGAASPPENAPVLDDADLHGPDGLAGCDLPLSDRQHRHPSEKVISELLRRFPNEITLVCLGPLTNLARLFQRDPVLTEAVDKVVISGGAVTHPGNVTPAAEFNMFFDPASAQAIFHSSTTKSLVPLDVTERAQFSVELLEQLPPRYSRAGSLLHRILTFAFRTYHQRRGRELIPLYDPVALTAVTNPELFQWEEMAGDVETDGELARGATIFDRRDHRRWRCNMEVARGIDATEVKAQIVRALRYAGQCTE